MAEGIPGSIHLPSLSFSQFSLPAEKNLLAAPATRHACVDFGVGGSCPLKGWKVDGNRAWKILRVWSRVSGDHVTGHWEGGGRVTLAGGGGACWSWGCEQALTAVVVMREGPVPHGQGRGRRTPRPGRRMPVGSA